jgi:small conductance mechanosensitive channel
VAYGTDLGFARQVVLDTVSATFDAVSKDDIIFIYTAFGDSSINFETRFWIDSTSSIEVAKAKSTAIMAIKEAFDREGINIPFPIRTLVFPESLTVNKK